MRIIDKYKNIPVQIKASLWFLICTVLQRGITIITTPIYTRLLTQDEYGLYSVFISWMGIFTCIVTLNLHQGIYQQAVVKFNDKRNELSTGFQTLTLSMVIFWYIIYFCFKSLVEKLISLDLFMVSMMFIVMWANAIFGFWSTEQRVDYKYKKLVLVTLIVAIVQPILCVALISVFSNRVHGLVLGMAIATLISYIALFFLSVSKSKQLIDLAVWKYALKLGTPLILHYLSTVVLNSSDRIMIQRIIGNEQAGIYNLAYTISICGTLINQAVLQTFSPWLLKKIKCNNLGDIHKPSYAALIGIAIINLGIILFTPELIKLFAPSTYYDAIWVMPPVTMSVFFMFMYNLFSTFEFYYEKTSYVSTATVFGAIINVLLNYICIKWFGYTAAGYTTLFCYISFAISHYYFMKKICKLELNNQSVYDSKILVAIATAFVAIGFLLMATYKITYIRYGLIILLLICCFIFRKQIFGFVTMITRRRQV